jgi:hypothetical protein
MYIFLKIPCIQNVWKSHSMGNSGISQIPQLRYWIKSSEMGNPIPGSGFAGLHFCQGMSTLSMDRIFVNILSKHVLLAVFICSECYHIQACYKHDEQWSSNVFCSWHTELLSWQHYERSGGDPHMWDAEDDYFMNTILTPYYIYVSKIYFKQSYL